MQPTRPSHHELAILKVVSEIKGSDVDTIVGAAYIRFYPQFEKPDCYQALYVAETYGYIEVVATGKTNRLTSVILTDKGCEVLSQLGA